LPLNKKGRYLHSQTTQTVLREREGSLSKEIEKKSKKLNFAAGFVSRE
jgi:hypothetical protein